MIMNELTLLLLIALNGALGSGVPKNIERFGGVPALIEATFLKNPGQEVTVEASIYLDGDQLLAPLGKPVPFTVHAGDDPRLLVGAFEIPLPEVKKPVVFRVLLTAKPAGAGSGRCGDFQITAFPQKMFSESLGEPESLPEIAIAGKFPGLRELLDKCHLRHRELNLKLPDALPPESLIIAEVPPDIDAAGFFPDAKKLFFATGASASAPWVLDCKAKSFIVNAQPPADFRESPLAQRMLLKLLQ